ELEGMLRRDELHAGRWRALAGPARHSRSPVLGDACMAMIAADLNRGFARADIDSHDYLVLLGADYIEHGLDGKLLDIARGSVARDEDWGCSHLARRRGDPPPGPLLKGAFRGVTQVFRFCPRRARGGHDALLG